MWGSWMPCERASGVTAVRSGGEVRLGRSGSGDGSSVRAEILPGGGRDDGSSADRSRGRASGAAGRG